MKPSKISAGSYDLNKFLYGGYETDIITTLYGPGGSGKSNFCMLLATSQAKKGNKIIFIDTEGSFSIDRIKQLSQYGGDMEMVLSNILLINPTSFSEQEKAFEQLLQHVKNESISLIIVDSMVMLYRLELGEAITSGEEEKISEVNRKLAKQLRTLNEIARKQKIPIVVTNQVYSSFIKNEENKPEKQISMVGGDLLKYWSKCLLELQHKNGKRKLIVRKHRSLPEKELSFEIISSGIRKRGLF
jgi:DNA repair protein RadB